MADQNKLGWPEYVGGAVGALMLGLEVVETRHQGCGRDSLRDPLLPIDSNDEYRCRSWKRWWRDQDGG